MKPLCTDFENGFCGLRRPASEGAPGRNGRTVAIARMHPSEAKPVFNSQIKVVYATETLPPEARMHNKPARPALGAVKVAGVRRAGVANLYPQIRATLYPETRLWTGPAEPGGEP